MSQFIIFHTRDVSKEQIGNVLTELREAGCKVIDQSNRAYLIEGPIEIGQGIVLTRANWRVSPEMEYKIPDVRPRIEGND